MLFPTAKVTPVNSSPLSEEFNEFYFLFARRVAGNERNRRRLEMLFHDWKFCHFLDDTLQKFSEICKLSLLRL